MRTLICVHSTYVSSFVHVVMVPTYLNTSTNYSHKEKEGNLDIPVSESLIDNFISDDSCKYIRKISLKF